MNSLPQGIRGFFGLKTQGRVYAHGFGCALAVLLGLAMAAVTSSSAQTFTTFNAPGAGTGKAQGTIALNINTAGAVTGIYYDSNGLAHGFVRPAGGGTIAVFDAPGAGTGTNQGTFPISINAAGTVVGMLANSSNVYGGFMRAANGTITSINVTGAGAGKHQGTMPMSINTAGAITGIYKDSSSQYHGFVRSANGKTTATFEAPLAGTGYALGTIPFSINTAGVVVGMYKDSTGSNHGFVRAANGTITVIDAPGAGNSDGKGTVALGINTAGVITGGYTDSTGVAHGFVRATNGTITTFDVPGAGKDGFLASLTPKGNGPPGQGTGGLSINTAGIIAGTYSDSNAMYHGFERAANGTITTFDAPGAGTGSLQGTVGFSINTAGMIAGTYGDANTVFHGFILVPPAPTTTTLKSAPNPSTFGQDVTFTAVVSSTAGTPPNGETVSFLKGKTVLGTGTLNAGSATFMTSTLPVGTNSITAVYGGDSNFAASTSKPDKQVVNKAGQ
jgi:hypothetical protein